MSWTSYSIFFKSIRTEKAAYLMNNFNKISFVVSRNIKKDNIKYFMKKVLGVAIYKIGIINVKSKQKRYKNVKGFQKSYKKAIISLNHKNLIKFFSIRNIK